MLPIVAIVGRPNVGKSTLFNVLTRTRDAIIADVAGVTRDRQYGYARLGAVPCVLIDTGGLVDQASGIEALMRAQTEKAVDESDRIIFLADARAGLTTQDRNIATELRRWIDDNLLPRVWCSMSLGVCRKKIMIPFPCACLFGS